MWKRRLEQLRDYLLASNTYLTGGFATAWWDSSSGKLLAFNGNGELITVFPQDTEGDYFYMRTPNIVKVVEDEAQNMAQCSVGYKATGDVTLVCMMRDGEPDSLVTNLLSTLQRFDTTYLRIKGAVYQNEYVLAQEFAKDENLLKAALQRVKKNYIFVSVTFTLDVPVQFIKQDCITKPCKTC
jgi:hypothetical protein